MRLGLRAAAIVAAACVAALTAIMLVWTLPWYGLLTGFLAIALLTVWCAVAYDVIKRVDLGTATKAVWVLALLLFPVIGIVVYYVTRPTAMTIRYD